MSDQIRVLILEDSPADAELVERELRRGGLDVVPLNVTAKGAYVRALGEFRPRIVLADYSLPDFDGITALRLARERGHEMPFILVSGTVGEELAVEALKLGATDYVLKGRLERLVPSVRRALREAEELNRRRRAEQALRASEERFRVLLDTAPYAVVVVDQAGRIVLVNPRVREFFGYEPNELVGETLETLVPETLRSVHERHRREYLRDARPRLIGRGRYLPARHRDGRIFSAEISLTPVPSAMGEQLVMATVVDVTEREQLETRLRQAQKMEAVGRLAGGIAHDFNNLLTAIRGYAELVATDLASDDARHRDIEQVIRAADRGADLTRQLLAFGRRQMLQPEVLDLNALMADIAPMLRRLIGEAIELRTVLDPTLGRVHADRSQLDQVLVNLAVNARDAMPDGGTLTIETANVELDEDFAATHASAMPGPHVLLAVSDTGVGMDSETQAHLFEPFFTTKAPGQGSGLGLATVYGIVKQSGGHVWVYSEPGHGSTLKVYLPRSVAEASGTAQPEPESVLAAPGGTGTILIVEDDESVREFARRTLEGRGYTVLTASNGAQALELAATHASPIDLLVSDLVMPGMHGRELASRLTELRSGLRVLFVSGYSESAVIRGGVLEPAVAFLPKPFTTDALARAVHRALSMAVVPGQ